MKTNNPFGMIFAVPALVIFAAISAGFTPGIKTSKKGKPPAAVKASPLSGKWVLVSLAGSKPLPKSRISVSFGKGRMGGYAGCNGYGGKYQADRAQGKLKTGSLFSTTRACMFRPMMRQESRYMALLRQVRRYKVSGKRLQLKTKAGDVLEFRFQPPPKTRPLMGTKWKVSGFASNGAVGSPVSGMTYTLQFKRGRVFGSTGCNGFKATYTIQGKSMSIKLTTVTKKACSAAYKSRQEQEFIQLLRSTASFRIQRDRLRLSSPGGKVLYLRAI